MNSNINKKLDYKIPEDSIIFKMYSSYNIPTWDDFKSSEHFNICKKIIEDRCNYYAKLLGVKINSVKLKAQKTRFGSASSRHNININWLLLFAPSGILDYVIVHEVSHLIEMNHSNAFWDVVKSIMPDYIKRDNWLRLNGIKLVKLVS